MTLYVTIFRDRPLIVAPPSVTRPVCLGCLAPLTPDDGGRPHVPCPQRETHSLDFVKPRPKFIRNTKI